MGELRVRLIRKSITCEELFSTGYLYILVDKLKFLFLFCDFMEYTMVLIKVHNMRICNIA